MNKLEEEMIFLLEDLKVNHNVLGVKTEFEAEGASVEEIQYLKQFISGLNLNLIIKIGGCEAINDLINAKKLGAKSVIAPMIESSFALKKFVRAINNVYSLDEKNNTDFYINIESITGFKNIDEIINLEDFKELSGIVFGRSDMVESLNYPKDYVDSDEIFEYANSITSKLIDKKFIVGGNITKKSLKFLIKLKNLSMFETRKIVFGAGTQIDKMEEGIIKALKFELLWLKNKQYSNLNFSQEHLKRIKSLELRCL